MEKLVIQYYDPLNPLARLPASFSKTFYSFVSSIISSNSEADIHIGRFNRDNVDIFEQIAQNCLFAVQACVQHLLECSKSNPCMFVNPKTEVLSALVMKLLKNLATINNEDQVTLIGLDKGSSFYKPEYG